MHIIVVILLFVAAVTLWRGFWYFLDMTIEKDVTLNLLVVVIAIIILFLYHDCAPFIEF